MSIPRIALVIVSTMVLVVLLASASPTAVGAVTSDDLSDGTPLSPQQTEADADLHSGASFWQGQQLAIDAADVVGGDGGVLQLWRVTADGQLNQQVASISVHANGTALVDTSSLEGRYMLRDGETPVYVQDGTAYTSSPPDGAAVTVDSSAFSVKTQTLSTSWSDPSVYPGQGTTLMIETNRERSVVAVSGENLSYANLTTVFPESAFAENYDARQNNSELLLEIGRSTKLRLNTSLITGSEGTLALDVVDTTARAAPTLTVNQPGDAHIKSADHRENVGDVIDVELACDHCFLVVGGAGQGLLDVVEIRDSDGDGNVSLRINTRYAGMARAQADFPNDVQAYTSPNDSVSRYASSQSLESVSEALITSTVSLSDLREELGLVGNGRTTPIEPATIRLTAASSDYLLPRWDYGDRAPTGSELVVKDETDVATVRLVSGSFGGVQSMAAPPSTGAIESGADLRGQVGPRDQIALGDRLVFRVDISGIYGYLAAHGTDVGTVGDNPEEGISLRLQRLAGEGTPNNEVIPLSQTMGGVVADPTNDHLYLVLETGGSGRTQLAAGDYRATFELEGVSGQAEGYSANSATDGYPYLGPGETLADSARATVGEPAGAIERPVEGSGPNMTAEGTLALAGRTSFAPGSTVTLVASATDYSWETSATTEVKATGNWSAVLDLSEAPGREFDVTLARDDSTLDSKTYTVYPAAKNASDDGSGSGGSGAGNDGSASNVAPDTGPTIPILDIQLPSLGGFADLAVPIASGLGVLAVVWLSWRLVVRRVVF